MFKEIYQRESHQQKLHQWKIWKKHPSNNEHLKKHNDFFPGWSLCSPHFFPLEWAFLLRKVGPCAGKDFAGDADVGLAHRQGASTYTRDRREYPPGTDISPPKGTFESMIFLFPFGGIWTRSLEGITQVQPCFCFKKWYVLNLVFV